MSSRVGTRGSAAAALGTCRAWLGGGLLLAAGLGLGACSSEDSETAAGHGQAATVAREDFVEAWAAAVCESLRGCCQAMSAPYDAQGCKDLMIGGLGEDLAVAVNSSKAEYDSAQAATCIAQGKEFAAGCGATTVSAPAACDKVFQGTVPAGGACTASEECAAPAGGTAHCEMTDEFTGVCMAEARGALGDPCSSTCSSGEGGGFCSGFAGPAAPPAPGAPNSTSSASATCHQEDGLYCNAETMLCEASLSIGSPCTDALECATGAACLQGVCGPPSGLDGPCDWDMDCGDGLYCEVMDAGGSCRALLGVGEPCMGSDSCAQGICDPRHDTCIASALPLAFCDGVVQ